MLSAMASQPISPHELDVSELVSAEHSLKMATTNANRTRLLRNICVASPYLESVTLRLSKILTHAFPDSEGGYLLSNAITAASIAYAESTRQHKQQEAHELAYVQALLPISLRLLDFQVFGVLTEGRTEAWQPMANTILDWAKRRRFNRIIFNRREVEVAPNVQQAIRTVLVTNLIPVDRPEEICRILDHVG